MTPSAIGWGSPEWLLPAAVLATLALVVLLRGYARAALPLRIRLAALLLKALAVAALALSLAEPLLHGTRPRPGANLFLLVADNSRSLEIRDPGATRSRGELLRALVEKDAPWRRRLSQDFEVRSYAFDTGLRAVTDFADLSFDGGASSLRQALSSAGERFRGRPLAGILFFTDGNFTDGSFTDGSVTAGGSTRGGAGGALASEEEIAAWGLPPVYPVPLGEDARPRDVRWQDVAVSQSVFETAPVTITAQVAGQGVEGEEVLAQVLDERGATLAAEALRLEDGRPATVRFRLRPEAPGIVFYTLRVTTRAESSEASAPAGAPAGATGPPGGGGEATLANNVRLVAVDRSGGPYRVLYVSGRPNWEFKFLRRALEAESEIDLVGLLRIARREPKFDYRARAGEGTNPLFRGFGNQGDEDAERYDEPVLIRLGTDGAEELRGGFPRTAEDLYRYHAVIVDDLEAEFFSADQKSLLEDFVSQRGGGLLMLAGPESFAGGAYGRSPIGEALPVYVDRLPAAAAAGAEHRLELTREGWLEPWMRLRDNESEERARFASMPPFRALDRVRGEKPGASVVLEAAGPGGARAPALVVQRYGKGRAAALLVGDLWRWSLRRKPEDERDLERVWRQTVRWLVSEVPGRVDVEVARREEAPGRPLAIRVRARDAGFVPLENASVTVRVTPPGGEELSLAAVASAEEAGAYEAAYVPRAPGAYRLGAVVSAPDGSAVGEREAGWADEGFLAEFRRLEPDRAALETIARATGGEVVSSGGLEAFVASLEGREAPVTEPWTYPLWHQWGVFVFALACLAGEWALRRLRGLP
jgi:uncharacterized membrane protein